MPKVSRTPVMDPLSKKMSCIRYGVVLFAMCATTLGLRGLKPTSFIGFILFAGISLKYPFFDSLVRMIRRRWPRLRVLPWLWIGYTLAATVDVAATWVTMADDGNASLALIATAMITPWFLVGAIALMAVHTYTSERSHPKKTR